MRETDTVSVAFTVIGVERVLDRGHLIGLAIVEVNILGVVLRLQGVQVIRKPGGAISCRPPQFRRPNGMWSSAVILPDELATALGAEVVAHLQSPLPTAIAGGQKPVA